MTRTKEMLSTVDEDHFAGYEVVLRQENCRSTNLGRLTSPTDRQKLAHLLPLLTLRFHPRWGGLRPAESR